MEDLESRLRGADERSVAIAMDQACIGWPINDRAELLEAFNRILDGLGVPDADGDIYVPEEIRVANFLPSSRRSPDGGVALPAR